MREVLIGDVVQAARALSSVAGAARRNLLNDLLRAAHAADLYRKRTGKPHPLWGNGSLLAATLLMTPVSGARETGPAVDLEVMATVIEGLIEWRRRER